MVERKKFGKAGKKNLSAAEDVNLRSETLENIQGGWKGDISPFKNPSILTITMIKDRRSKQEQSNSQTIGN